MKIRKRLNLALAASTLAMAGAANATVIHYGSELDADGVPTTTVDGATVIDFNDGLCGYADCSGNFDVVNGDSSGVNAAPFVADTGSDDDTDYLTVPQDVGTTPVSALLELGTTANYFGLFWGSIDSYNTIEFLLGATIVGSFTGSDVTMPNAANGNQTAPSTNTYVNFHDLPTFDAVRLTSTQYAFESDNHAYATVPAPGTLALLGGSLLALAALRRRRLLVSC